MCNVFTLTLDINPYHLSVTGSSGLLQGYSSGACEHKESKLKPVPQPHTQENAHTTACRNRQSYCRISWFRRYSLNRTRLLRVSTAGSTSALQNHRHRIGSLHIELILTVLSQFYLPCICCNPHRYCIEGHPSAPALPTPGISTIWSHDCSNVPLLRDCGWGWC